MDKNDIRKLIQDIKSGSVSEKQAMTVLRRLPFGELGMAKVDHHRGLRQGFPEVILGQGKTVRQINAIVAEMLSVKTHVLITRVSTEQVRGIKRRFAQAVYNEQARTVVIKSGPVKVSGKGTILILTGGTSDIPVAEEARETAQILGNKVQVLYDVGVAGIHRLLKHSDQLEKARVLIVVAGMEGALASVVGGLVDKPIIAVPTSVGYGASFNGLAALLSMLNSCAAGVSVVNIDNGFGAACTASLINRL